MSQTPPNSGWQGGPNGPGQPWNAGAPQGQPGYQPQGGPAQGFGAPTGQPGGYPNAPQGGPRQGYAPGGPQGGNPNAPQGGPQQGYTPGGPQQGYGQGSPGGPGGAPAKPKPKAKLIVAGVLALAVIGAGVGVAMYLFRGASPVASEGLPASVSFAAEINLAPANADKLALKNIVEKYPSLQTEGDFGTDYKAALWGVLAKDSTDAPDYETEVKPWLGDSVAIGSTGSTEAEIGDSANLVLAIETTDKAKAKAFAESKMDDTKVDFIDNLMIVTGARSDLTTDEIKKAPLADSEEYKADMAKLGGGSLATVWFGSGMIDAALDQAAQQGVDTGTIDTTTLQGAHGAAGLKVAENKLTLDLQVQTPNAPENANVPDVSESARNLSGNSLVALAAGATTDLSQAWDLLAEQPDLLDAFSQFGIESATDLSALIGTKITAALDWDEDSQMPVIGATFASKDPGRQKEILDKINNVLTEAGGIEGLEVTQQGDTGVVGFGQSADQVLNPASKLGDLDGFKKVVDGKAQAVLFVNVEALKGRSFYQRLISSSPEAGEALDPITAIGMTANNSGDHYAQAQFHVTFK